MTATDRPFCESEKLKALQVHRCHVVYASAVRCGFLVRANACDDCGNVGPVEGHHQDHLLPLSVRWLCKRCHSSYSSVASKAARKWPTKPKPCGRKLTEKQTLILAWLIDQLEGKRHSPTVREIGLQFGIRSPNGVMCHLRALEAKGYIENDPLISRSIRILRREMV